MNDDEEMRDIERAVEASLYSFHQRLEDDASALLAVSLQNEEFQTYLNNNMGAGVGGIEKNYGRDMDFRGTYDDNTHTSNAGNDISDIPTIDLTDSVESNAHTIKNDNRGINDDRAPKNDQDMEDFQYAQALDQSLEVYEVTKLNDELYDNAIYQTVERTEEKNKGSWDCVNCTFTNQPYQRKCKMCGTQAPCHVLTFEGEKYQNIPFGVEIEIIIPDGKQDGFTLQSIAMNLTKLGPETVHFEGYTHNTTNYWKIVTDASIRENNHNHDLCFELVSPVLKGEDGLASLRNVMSNIRTIGISTNSSCGFHVHVDASDNNDPSHTPIGSLVGLKRIAQHFVSLENAFDLIVARMGRMDNKLLVGGNRRANNNKYCRSNRILFGEQSNRQRWTSISNIKTKHDLVKLMNPDRYRKLNLTNIISNDRPSTIEFRQHGGVEDIQMAEVWVRFILLFCCNASSSENENDSILDESASPNDELLSLFNLVRCEGLQQFFTLDRKLFENHTLSNQWQCRVCHRWFNSSRSLSQHVSACRHY